MSNAHMHVGSKEVQIRRKEIVDSHLPTTVLNESKQAIGSIFRNVAPLSGLTPQEEDQYMPRLLGVSRNDPGFRDAVKAYWASLSIKVPSGGVVLQIGVNESGEPINLSDWIKYRWILEHKLVGINKDIADSNPTIRFYIFDPAKESERENIDITFKRKAYVEFAKISGDNRDISTLRRVVRILGDTNPDNMSGLELENAVDALINSKPEEFHRIVTDKNLSIKGSIFELVDAGIINKIGHSYVYMDMILGDGVDEVVMFLRKEENSAIVTEMKAKKSEYDRSRSVFV